MDPKHAATRRIRLVFNTGASEYWGVQETDWTDGARALRPQLPPDHQGPGVRPVLHGSNLHMVVLRRNGSTYWVVNTLLDSLSNETMLAIAKGLKPLTSIH